MSQSRTKRFASLPLVLASLLSLSACVANNSSQPIDITSLLDASLPKEKTSPSENNISSDKKTALPLASDSAKAANAAQTTTQSASTESALKQNTAPTPAQTAAAQIAQPAPSASNTDQTATAANTTTPTTKPAQATQPSATPEKKQSSNSFFASLFQSNQAGKTTRSRSANQKPIRPKPTVISSIRKNNRNTLSALPGVREKQAFGIEEEGDEGDTLQLASVAGRARRGTHGLLLQRDTVKVGCFPPRLLRILKKVERHFGRVPVVTSGYRSPAYNRRIRGARNSMHVHCKAADIQIPGVSKWTLAKYLRTIDGRGGVGTYCHTRSVHIDIGKQRDWNRRCRRKRRK